MMRPWFEAVPALAAAGVFTAPAGPLQHPLFFLKGIAMAEGTRFAFLPRIDATTKPLVFPDLRSLAVHIERHRDDVPFQLEDVDDLIFAGVSGLHDGVQVWLLDMDGNRDRSLGYAWLDGHGRDVLEPALIRVRKAAQRRAA